MGVYRKKNRERCVDMVVAKRSGVVIGACVACMVMGFSQTGSAASENIVGVNGGHGRIGTGAIRHMTRPGTNVRGIVANIGRGGQVDTIVPALEHRLRFCSTYGTIEAEHHGRHYKGPNLVQLHKVGPMIGKSKKPQWVSFKVADVPVKFLLTERNPKDIPWADEGVRHVIDATGAYLDPTLPADAKGGSLRGHIESDSPAQRVIASAPFKVKFDPSGNLPDDAIMVVNGINDHEYQREIHRIKSPASCTTTCLSYMVKPLLEKFGRDAFLTMGMTTIHAGTGSQQILDTLAKDGAVDLRKNRSLLNNIIPTTTGAAGALAKVLKDVADIPFVGDAVRVATNTSSLVILNATFARSDIRREDLHQIYEQAAQVMPFLHFSKKTQRTAVDVIGFPHAAAVIEGERIHTRSVEAKNGRGGITQAVIYAWYDNEVGSYVASNMMELFAKL